MAAGLVGISTLHEVALVLPDVSPSICHQESKKPEGLPHLNVWNELNPKSLFFSHLVGA